MLRPIIEIQVEGRQPGESLEPEIEDCWADERPPDLEPLQPAATDPYALCECREEFVSRVAVSEGQVKQLSEVDSLHPGIRKWVEIDMDQCKTRRLQGHDRPVVRPMAKEHLIQMTIWDVASLL